MKKFIDYQGKAVRLTDERLAHIIEHPEMVDMEAAIGETLNDPQLVMIENGRNSQLELPVLLWDKSRRQMAMCCGKVWSR